LEDEAARHRHQDSPLHPRASDAGQSRVQP
jgi:hypothetical protein